FGAAFLAAAAADVVTRLASGQLPVFTIPSYPVPPVAALPIFAILGVAAGLLGVVFNRSLLWTLDCFGRLRGRWSLLAVAAVGAIAHALAPSVLPQPAIVAVVGMAAYFTAIVRAPLTGVVLIIEMTGNYEQMLPLLISCFCAYAVAEYLRSLPIYEALLERD